MNLRWHLCAAQNYSHIHHFWKRERETDFWKNRHSLRIWMTLRGHLWSYCWMARPEINSRIIILKNVRNCHFAIVRHLNRLFAYQKLNVSKWRCTSFYFLRFSLGLPWPLIPNAKRTLRTMNLYRPTASWCPAKSSTDTLTWPKIAWST